MDIKGWSNLIYRYYFEKGSRERVLLHISMQDLLDFAKDDVVDICKDKCASSFNDEDLIKDFVHKFWICPSGNKSLKDLERKINQITALAKMEGNFVLLLSILAILIMPFCENDELELHGNDYYGHLLPFLQSHRFADKVILQTFWPTLNWTRSG